MMGISCENFVMIGLVLSSYKDLNILLLRLESPIHVQKLFLGRGVAPKFSTSFRPSNSSGCSSFGKAVPLKRIWGTEVS